MDSLRRWALSLAMLTLLSGIAESLVPQGSTRKYVRVALGMILLSMMLEPVIAVVAQARSVNTGLLPPGWDRQVFSGTGSSGKLEASNRFYQERIRWQVESMASSVQGVVSARAQVVLEHSATPQVSRIELDVSLNPESRGRAAAVEEALRALLSAYLNVGRDRITVRSSVVTR